MCVAEGSLGGKHSLLPAKWQKGGTGHERDKRNGGGNCQIRIRIPPLGRSWLHPKFQNAPQRRRSPRRLQLSSDRCRGANAARRIRDAPAWGRHKRAASSRQLGLDTLSPPPPRYHSSRTRLTLLRCRGRQIGRHREGLHLLRATYVWDRKNLGGCIRGLLFRGPPIAMIGLPA